MIGRAEYGALLKNAGIVDEVLSWDAPEFADLFKEDPQPRTSLAQRLRRSRLVLGWFHQPPSQTLRQNLRMMGRQDSHFIIRDPSSSLSLSEYFFEKTAALLKAYKKPAFSFEECARLPIQPSPRKPKTGRAQVIIHPGSGGESKCWLYLNQNYLKKVQGALQNFLLLAPKESRALLVKSMPKEISKSVPIEDL